MQWPPNSYNFVTLLFLGNYINKGINTLENPMTIQCSYHNNVRMYVYIL